MMTKEVEEELRTIGVRDSKLVAPAKRDRLYALIEWALWNFLSQCSYFSKHNRWWKERPVSELVGTYRVAKIGWISPFSHQYAQAESHDILRCTWFWSSMSIAAALWNCLLTGRKIMGMSSKKFFCKPKWYPGTEQMFSLLVLVLLLLLARRLMLVKLMTILAKVERDMAIKKLELEIGMKVGSGYPSDPTTIEFLKKWHKDNTTTSTATKHIRHSWKTVENLDTPDAISALSGNQLVSTEANTKWDW